MRPIFARDAVAHYILTVVLVAILSLASRKLFGLPAPFSTEFLFAGVPISLLVGLYNSQIVKRLPRTTVLRRAGRILLSFAIVSIFGALIGGAIAFYVPPFRPMMTWQMLAAIFSATAAVMTWTFLDGFVPMARRGLIAFATNAFVFAMSICVTKYLASSGWIIDGLPRI